MQPFRHRVGFALAILFAINTMNFFDRQILGAVAEDVRREWGLSDKQIGALGTAFTLLYAVVGLPLGRLADRFHRGRMLSAGLFVWSLLTALSGMARSFRELFIVRLGVGVGEATCAPAATSLIGDLVPPTGRAKAMSIFMMGLPVGIALSFAVSGSIAQYYGWRTAFYVAGLPGAVFALVVLLLPEPVRGAKDTVMATASASASPYRTILSIPTLWWIIASGALHNFNMYALGGFLSPMLIRYHHLESASAGMVSMATYGLSGVPGLLVGGWAADLLMRRRLDGRLIVGATALLLSAPLVYFALTCPVGDVAAFTILLAPGCALMYVYYSSVYATIHDVVAPSLRATAMALYFCAMYVLGASLGPYLTGAASDYFAMAAAARAGVVSQSAAALEPIYRAEGLHSAMYMIPLLNLALAGTLFAASTTVAKDIDRARGATTS